MGDLDSARPRAVPKISPGDPLYVYVGKHGSTLFSYCVGHNPTRNSRKQEGGGGISEGGGWREL
jgi:hypothetical protein